MKQFKTTVAHLLVSWLEQQQKRLGKVFSGEVGCRLRRDPDTTVGIDVAYCSAEMVARSSESTLLEGAPILAVEILSPSDKEEDINEKVDEYLAAGVALVWLIDPHLETVEVCRPGGKPELFNTLQELSGDPHLPGFRVPVARIFAD